MKDLKQKKTANDIADMITNTVSENVNKIIEVLDLDLCDLISELNGLDKNARDDVFSILINNSLSQLKECCDIETYHTISRKIDDVTDYYEPKQGDFVEIEEECDYIANDVMYKVLGTKDRKLDLPLNVSIIKDYCFSSEIKKEQFSNALMWIALRYITIIQYIKYDSWKQKYIGENSSVVVN